MAITNHLATYGYGPDQNQIITMGYAAPSITTGLTRARLIDRTQCIMFVDATQRVRHSDRTQRVLSEVRN